MRTRCSTSSGKRARRTGRSPEERIDADLPEDGGEGVRRPVAPRCADGDAGGRPASLFRRRGFVVLHGSGPQHDGRRGDLRGRGRGAGRSPVLSPAGGQGRLVRRGGGGRGVPLHGVDDLRHMGVPEGAQGRRPRLLSRALRPDGRVVRMKSYVELVRQRLEDRGSNIVGNLERFMEPQLRFTMRIFGDCLDEDAREKMFSGYSEHLTEQELRAFAADFVPAYTAYAIAELEEKKKDGERYDPPFLTQEEYQEMAAREKWPRIAGQMDGMTAVQLRREG